MLISRSLQEIRDIDSTVAMVLRICSFIKNVLHHGRSTCNFPNFSEFLENLWANSWYSSFKAVYFRYVCLLLKAHWVWSLEFDQKLISFTKRSRMKPMACLLFDVLRKFISNNVYLMLPENSFLIVVTWLYQFIPNGAYFMLSERCCHRIYS